MNKNKMNTSETDWPLKPRGQKPLEWALTSRVRIPNGESNQKIHAVRDRTKKETS